MEILNALDLKKGKKAKHNRMWSISQPLQFLSVKEKDQDWAAWNMDWLEWHGVKQISKNARKFMKNYKLANGIIDRSDYVDEGNNEMKDVVGQLAQNSEVAALELKFYPLIPNIVNTLVAEFAKRDKRVSFRANDEYTHNEIMDGKKGEIEAALVQKAQSKLIRKMIEMGEDPNDPEIQKLIQKETSPEQLRTLPEIQEFYAKDYEVICEKWASKQHIIDEERFGMDELEERAFRDKLVIDREYWHFEMMADDYKVELWNPVLSFHHKSPKVRYISDGNFVGNIELMTGADVIDTHGWKMNEEQLKSLQDNTPLTYGPAYATGAMQNDGSFYDATKSHDWNVGPPSLGMRQLLAAQGYNGGGGNDILQWIQDETEDAQFNTSDLFRVTTSYWKSQRKLGHLTKVHENGSVTNKIITEEYDVTEDPIYNTTLISNRTSHNLVFGEHIEWVWINHVWGGVKIGPNTPTVMGVENSLGIAPIYLGINQNRIKPLKFQFKGEHTLYGSKLPVEGRVFTDRNSKSSSVVDAGKPFQIGYNLVNNQIADILIDEIGTVIALDQNTLPKHSLGEDWGKGNYAKAYVAMKDFSILPLDTSITNTENALNFQHFQTLDLEQTNRLMSRVQLAQYFKQQLFETVGVAPSRMGQQIGQTATATEVEQTQVGSFAQTEMHYVEHSDHLMPRVHSMRTDLAQWYHSTNPSIRLQHMTSNDERVNFEINGKELMLRDINVTCTTKANARRLLEEMKKLAVENNTTGASIYDLGEVMRADSLGTLNTALKEAEAKAAKLLQEERAHEEKMQGAQSEHLEKEKQMVLDHESLEAEKNRRKDILVAEIKASGFGAMQDINENQQSDFVDNMEKIRKTQAYDETANINQEKLSNNRSQHSDKMNDKREDRALKKEEIATNLAIAKENRNRYDIPKTTKKKPDKKS